jgi:hypothetical protein
MSAIDYDLGVEDFIARLNATGHVTHESYKKTSVTLHHNAGNLTHAGVLAVWKVRPASAHFDVDAKGKVAQYVEVTEYAWGAGSTLGNERSIHIEMANETFAPNWTVSETTWKAAARLAAWLFAHVVHARPNVSNLFPHKHWSSTACPGPYVSKVFNKILVEAQVQYDKFMAEDNAPVHPTPPHTRKTVVELAHEVIAGKWGNGPDRTHALLVAGYDPNAVQAEVDREMRGNSNPATKSVHAVALEVLKGKWGNGPDRIARLTRAGYNANAVQAEVNRLS